MDVGVALVGEHRPSAMIALVRRIEALGFDRVWFTDERFHRDAFVNMTAAACSSDRIGIGCMVTDPFIRHPALTAAAAATLDEMSRERFVLGVGAGISGFQELGITRHRPARAIREAIELIHRLSAGERDVVIEGDVVRFGPGGLDFRPVRRVPVYVAGRGPRVLEAAGAVADGVVVGSHASGEGIEWSLRHAERGASRAGRDFAAVRRISWLYVSVSTDRAAARDAVRVGVAVAISGSRQILDQIGIALPAHVLEFMDAQQYRFDRDRLAALGALLPDDLLDRFSIAGSETEVRERLAAIRDLGMDEVALWPFPAKGDDLESLIDVLGERIAPDLR